MWVSNRRIWAIQGPPRPCRLDATRAGTQARGELKAIRAEPLPKFAIGGPTAGSSAGIARWLHCFRSVLSEADGGGAPRALSCSLAVLSASIGAPRSAPAPV